MKYWPFLLASMSVHAEQYCFTQDHVDPVQRNEWTHNTVVLWAGKPRLGPDGRTDIPLSGYGYDYAMGPDNDVDVVHLVGGATQRTDGTWTVSVTGTLLQKTIESMFGIQPYYLISLWWNLDPATLHGYGRQGNLSKNFGAVAFTIPLVDDFYPTVVKNVDCNSIPKVIQ